MDALHAAMFRVAYNWATWSHDPSSQNGAILVRYQKDGFEIVSFGFNHVPHMSGAALEAVLADRTKKYARVIHAEVDAIANAALRGKDSVYTTLVCPWAACLGCVGPILRAGITRVIVHKQRLESPYQAWNAGIAEAHAWLLDAGVELLSFDGPVPGAPAIRIDYKEWDPMFVRKSTYDALRAVYNAVLGTEYDDLMRLFTNARRRNEDLRADRDAYKAEADHYRQLTADLDARLEAVTVIRSEFQALGEKLESI